MHVWLRVWLWVCLLIVPSLVFAQTTPWLGNRVTFGHDNHCVPTTASGTAYACALGYAMTAYPLDALFSFRADVANTGAATINYGPGARPIMKRAGGVLIPLVANDLCTGQRVLLGYDGTNMQMLSPTCSVAAGGVSDGDKTDITVSASGTVWTIDPNTITYAKLQQVTATDRLLGRDTAGAGVVEEIAPAAAKTLLAISCADLTDEGTGCSGAGLTDGDKTDITVSAGGTAWTIDANVVTYAKLQDVSATDRLLGRDTAGAGDVEEITPGERQNDAGAQQRGQYRRCGEKRVDRDRLSHESGELSARLGRRPQGLRRRGWRRAVLMSSRPPS